ncbi:Alternative oxidase, mitochondrial, partial [Saitozyma sp. JCM 24511]
MSLVLRPMLVRPAVLARPLVCSSLLHPSSRAFSISARAAIQAARPHQASTALKTEVREREVAADKKIVGSEGKGAEGLHYQADIVSHDNGDWTLFNPIYNQAEVDCVRVVGRTPVTLSDKLAHGAVKTLRRMFDLCTGYKNTHIPESTLKQNPIPIKELRAKGELLSDKDWLLRIILLESFAGVPGMIAGTLRHLRSLRLLRRDGGWIHTLLEEAENERMHLLTFMTIAQPTWFTRALVLACQGMAYNMLFLAYIFAPKVVHRFVGALEEEAVRTYTHCVQDIERGLVPEWNNAPAPRIAIDYWRLPTSATLLDVIKAVRADEATHRFVNHSLANLDQKLDFNPFALAEASAEIRGTKACFTREESAEFARTTQQSLLAAGEQ